MRTKEHDTMLLYGRVDRLTTDRRAALLRWMLERFCQRCGRKRGACSCPAHTEGHRP